MIKRHRQPKHKHDDRDELRGRKAKHLSAWIIAPKLDREPYNTVDDQIRIDYLSFESSAPSKPNQETKDSKIRRRFDQLCWN